MYQVQWSTRDHLLEYVCADQESVWELYQLAKQDANKQRDLVRENIVNIPWFSVTNNMMQFDVSRGLPLLMAGKEYKIELI